MTIEEKKQYTKHTILTCNKKRIQEVLKRYWNIKPAPDIVKVAERIFNG